MADWRRCTGGCRRVLPVEQFDGLDAVCRLCLVADDAAQPVSVPSVPGVPTEAEAARPRPRRGPEPGTVRRPDARARAVATKRLIALHQTEYDRLFAEELERAR